MVSRKVVPRYLIRFDDICPTMDWEVWDIIEAHLNQYQVRPLLAVVPDNCDPFLIIGPPREDFWAHVRNWQSKGYTIALHGYQHRYVNKNGGLLGITYQSEFAGLLYSEQKAKLQSGYEIFTENGVRVDAWIAPSHSFDKITVEILAELGITVISDGLHCFPFTDALGITWIPQQLWNFAPQSAGIWTVCYHHNNWTAQMVSEFTENLEHYAADITDVTTVIGHYAGRKATLVNHVESYFYWIWNHYLAPIKGRVRRIINLSHDFISNF